MGTDNSILGGLLLQQVRRPVDSHLKTMDASAAQKVSSSNGIQRGGGGGLAGRAASDCLRRNAIAGGFSGLGIRGWGGWSGGLQRRRRV